MTRCIGVTGIIGTGKTTVCRMLEEQGAHFINTDDIVHALYRPSEAGWKKIRDFFGDEYLNKDGVNRKKLRKTILRHPQKLWILNRMIHPLVAVEVNKIIVQSKSVDKSIFCIEAVYFEEGDLGRVIDFLVEVQADPQQILERLADRDLTRQEILRFIRMKPRLPREPDFILNNRGTLEDLKKEVLRLWSIILSR